MKISILTKIQFRSQGPLFELWYWFEVQKTSPGFKLSKNCDFGPPRKFWARRNFDRNIRILAIFPTLLIFRSKFLRAQKFLRVPKFLSGDYFCPQDPFALWIKSVAPKLLILRRKVSGFFGVKKKHSRFTQVKWRRVLRKIQRKCQWFFACQLFVTFYHVRAVRIRNQHLFSIKELSLQVPQSVNSWRRQFWGLYFDSEISRIFVFVVTSSSIFY